VQYSCQAFDSKIPCSFAVVWTWCSWDADAKSTHAQTRISGILGILSLGNPANLFDEDENAIQADDTTHELAFPGLNLSV
jgi:hypothetical protein|tara:strand:- start:135511 stop:135750 length:240 start_codon:yes stop_codon:yes gene_type:complete